MMRDTRRVSVLLVLLSLAPHAVAASGRHFYVHPELGNDKASGLAATPSGADGPVRTIARAIKLAGPGDTVDLAPVQQPYKESAVFHNRSGEPGRPIVLDGHGATLSGCEPLVPADWQMVAPGLYRNAKLLRTDPAVIGRYFFRFTGQMNHMGRTSKGVSAPLKKPEELQPGQWTYQKPDDAFYIKIDPDKRLSDYQIEAPIRSNGVAISGHCEHLVIRNVVATHVYNDGYNVHGTTRDILFKDIVAIECGDDGLSAHDDCQVDVDGFVSIGNSTGVCNVGHSRSTNNRLLIKDILGADFYMIGSNIHTLTNSAIYASGSKTVFIVGQGQPDDVCTLKMDNVLIKCAGRAKVMTFAKGSIIEANRVTIEGLGMDVLAKSVTLRRSIVGGDPLPEITIYPGVQWTADQNLYDLRFLRIDQTFYTAKSFDQYRRSSGQDNASTWSAVKFGPTPGAIASPQPQPGTGVDPSRLPINVSPSPSGRGPG